MSKIPGRGHREINQQGKMLLQISTFASGMLKLVHVSAAQNADVLPAKTMIYRLNDGVYERKHSVFVFKLSLQIVILCLQAHSQDFQSGWGISV